MSVCSLQNFIQKVWKENAFTASLLALGKCHKTNIIKTFILICIFKNHIYSNKRKNTIFRSSSKRGYFPKDIFPSGNFPRVFFHMVTSQMCNFPSRNIPNLFFVAALGALALPSRIAYPLLQPAVPQKA